MSGNAYAQKTNPRDIFLFLLVVAPYYLNDFVFIATKTASQWLAADYASKFLGLMIVIAILPFRDCVKKSFVPLKELHEPLPMTIIRIGTLIFVCLLVMVASEYFVLIPLLDVFPETILFSYPRIDVPLLYWFDLTFGLALTAISEEFVFRSIAKSVIGKFSDRTSVILIVSGVIFALAHWSHGVANVADNLISGILLMTLYLHTRSIAPPIIVHYLINVWHFA